MKEASIYNAQDGSVYSILDVGNFEYVNPIEKMSEVIINSSMMIDRNFLFAQLENGQLPSIGKPKAEEIIERVIAKNALLFWEKQYKNIMSQKLPENLFELLESISKKNQIKILKRLSLTSDEMLSFIFKAYLNYGFNYSVYSSSHHHTGLDESNLPAFAYKQENEEIVTIGNTNLTKGQIKQAIIGRNVTVSKFLDNGDTWHCFFLTYKSINGQERGWEGKPHIHYISNNWGLSRAEVLTQLSSKNYKLPSPLPHIVYHTYRNPR